MLTTRLDEIPGEIRGFAGDDPHAAQVLEMVQTALPIVTGFMTHPYEFAIIDHGTTIGPIPNLDARLVFETGAEAETARMQQALSLVMGLAAQQAGTTLEAAPNAPGMTMMAFPDAPAGRLLFGPAGADQGRFVIGIDLGNDGIDLAPIAFDAPAGLPAGDLGWQALIDARAMADLFERVMQASGDPHAQQFVRTMHSFLPPAGEPLDLVAGGAVVGEKSHTLVRGRGFMKVADKLAQTFGPMIGVQSFRPAPLDPKTLALIPRNALTCSTATKDLTGANSMISMAALQFGLLELVPVFQALGDKWVYYTSDETGGGGLSSLVVINADPNPEEMVASLNELVTELNARATVLHGYVRVSSWSVPAARGAAIPAYTLSFPGVPVPLAISLGVADGRLVLGASPQALVAAVDHWRSGRESITANPRFQQATGGGLLEGATQMKFTDVPAAIARGYSAATGLGAMMANFVRSPRDPGRDPGLITPTVAQLSEGAQPRVSVTKIEGDDFVYIATMDRSWLVNAAGMYGAAGVNPAMLAFVGAALAGAGEEISKELTAVHD